MNRTKKQKEIIQKMAKKKEVWKKGKFLLTRRLAETLYLFTKTIAKSLLIILSNNYDGTLSLWWIIL